MVGHNVLQGGKVKILVDDPAAFAPAVVGAQPAAAADLAAADRVLWEALAGAAAPWTGAGPELPGGFWHRGFLVASPAASQFDVLRTVTTAAAPAGPVWCLAGGGEGCRGQRGRPWLALPGNLQLSVALPAPPAVAAAGLVLNGLAVVATLDAVRALLPAAPAGIKWVNDLWLDGAKAAGVLTAARRRPAGGEVFLGIGLNVAAAPDLPGDRFSPCATCLDAWAPSQLPLARVLVAVLTALRRRWEELGRAGPGPLVAAYRDASLATGRQVSVWADGDGPQARPLHTGLVTGVSDDLGLLLSGTERPLYAGRLSLAEP
jgi:BirA family biotin operon repressor/biotin-[acetyl-CoA-carboxylase] ligase